MSNLVRFLRSRVAVTAALFAFALTAPNARAAVPALMNYQGYLADNSGNPVSGTYAITFKLYADSTTATPLWTESYASVPVTSGVFNVLLGSVSPLGPTVLSGARLFLLTNVNGTDVLPRRPIVTVAYAFRAGVADSAAHAGASGGDITGQVQISCGPGSPAGALVYIPGRSFIAYAASDGTFDLGAVPPGTYALHIVTTGSGTADVANVTVTAGIVTNAGVVAVGANLQTDVNNCGACGSVCSSNHDTPSCVAGVCQAACNTGYANCDNNAVNGCEISTAADPANCGSCAHVCSAGPNSSPVCTSGSCGVTCNGGYADCNLNPADGCEVHTVTDINNCGSCGFACATRPNSTPSCFGGTCFNTCSTGYRDCNLSPYDGCEVYVLADANNCGGCGITCQSGHACVNGACQ